jgi:hypothetical protein
MSVDVLLKIARVAANLDVISIECLVYDMECVKYLA